MDLDRLELSLTNKCNSQCIYCQADAGPWQNEVMEVSDAHNYLSETAKVADLKSFLLFGGESIFRASSIGQFLQFGGGSIVNSVISPARVKSP